MRLRYCLTCQKADLCLPNVADSERSPLLREIEHYIDSWINLTKALTLKLIPSEITSQEAFTDAYSERTRELSCLIAWRKQLKAQSCLDR
jgi:hypothetical protein